MQYIILSLIVLFCNILYAEEIIIDATATTNITTFTLANKSTYSIFKSDGSWTSTLGDYGHLECMGPIEKSDKYFKLNHMCEYTNQSKIKFWARVIREGNQDADAGVGKIIIVDAIDNYKKFIGYKCNYAIKYLDNKIFTTAKCR